MSTEVVEVTVPPEILVINETATHVVEVTDGLTCVDIIKSDTVEITTPQIQIVDVYNPSSVHKSSTHVGGNPFADGTTPFVNLFNLKASPGLAYVELTWTAADYWNHSYTEIWRNTTDNRGTASFVGSSKTNVFTDPAEPKITYYYWIRHVSYYGAIGDWNALAGVQATPGLVVANLLAALEGQIQESQLTNSLTERIDVVEINSDRLDSVIANQETDYSVLVADINTRATSIAFNELDTKVTEHDGVITAQSQEITTLSTNIDGHQTTLEIMGESVDGISAQYTVKIDNNGNVSGYGLASTPPQADGTESEFTVLADKFSILHPNATDPTDPKLVFTVFEGRTVMDAAYIINLKADYITAGTIDAEIELNTAIINSGEIHNEDFNVDTQGNVEAKSIVIINDAGEIMLNSHSDIDGAFIKNATVDTLTIANNAVTVPSILQAADMVMRGPTVYTPALLFDAGGGGYIVTGTTWAYARKNDGKVEMQMQVKENGGAWVTVDSQIAGARVGGGLEVTWHMSFTLTHGNTIGIDTVAVRLVYKYHHGYITLYKPTLTAMGAKR